MTVVLVLVLVPVPVVVVVVDVDVVVGLQPSDIRSHARAPDDHTNVQFLVGHRSEVVEVVEVVLLVVVQHGPPTSVTRHSSLMYSAKNQLQATPDRPTLRLTRG